MVSFTTTFLNDRATLWTKIGLDGFGQPLFAPPKVIRVRWEYRLDQTIGAEGEAKISQARAFVSKDIEPGCYMFPGVSTEKDPHKVQGAYSVAHFRKVPDLNNNEAERVAYLSLSRFL